MRVSSLTGLVHVRIDFSGKAAAEWFGLDDETQ